MCIVLVVPFYLFKDYWIEEVGNLTLEGGDLEGGFVEGFGMTLQFAVW
jgi:hypothetical protein